MNAVDLLLLVIIGVTALAGIRRGFIGGLLDLSGVVIALVLAATFYSRLIDPLQRLGLERSLAAVIAFLFVNLVVIVLFGLVTSVLLRILLRRYWPLPLRVLDSMLGIVPGLVKGFAVAALVVLPLAFLQQPSSLGARVRDSELGSRLVDGGLDAIYTITDRYDLDLADFAVITSRPSEGTIKLPFQVTSGLAADSSAERVMLQLVNKARADAGLAPLQFDDNLTQVARAHSQEMFELGYFSHDSPVHGDPAARLAAAGINYAAAGENLAFAPSVTIAHDGLMHSPPHRANILNPAFTRVGIGIIRSDKRGIMVTQEFAA